MAGPPTATPPRLTAAEMRPFEALLWGIGCDSTNRMQLMLDRIEREPDHVFWSVLLYFHSDCDDLSAHLPRLLRHIRRRGPALPYLDEDDRAFYDGLPLVVPVFRGGNGPVCFDGLSWTTDVAVAREFALGHRGMRHPAPTVAAGAIPKGKILWVSTGRNESEGVLRPGDVRDRRMMPVTGEPDADA